MNIEQNTKQAQELAKRAYEQATDNPHCVITYAFSLYVQGRTTEGWEILQKLPAETLHEPHAAVYVAVLLLDLNQTEAAKEYIQIARKGPIYAEEKHLLEDEVNKAAGISPTPTPSPTATSKTTPAPEASTPEPAKSSSPEEH